MIESFSDPDILLYCPSAAAVLGTWAKHEPDGNSVCVWGLAVLLHHTRNSHGSRVLVCNEWAGWGLV